MNFKDVGCCLAVVWQLSGSCLAVIWQLSGSHLTVVWLSTGSHLAVVRQLGSLQAINCLSYLLLFYWVYPLQT